ncbi:glycine betaine ABC transporter substrate-binding protein [Risungbinella massiliensis]|uniref:glycine betaine ABC transporter substrate-binding protein n=1 Tax=Risungbinella massiliensis TaxID=1329796 RepID=UPI0005CC3460|nr:glycine betaine ABC transporter substrate-binding protein [Risungbinella massiliensis]
MTEQNFFSLFIQTVQNRWPEILIGLQQHLYLSLVSILIASLISIPLGIYISRHKRIAEPIIGAVSIFQTIPSLALFGFLLPIFGIGSTTAIIALTIYALLPILRNTYTGIIGVDSSVIEAGRGMGMTNYQILRMIELPLALPVIMAGLRTATVLTIGVATLSAFIGAGGMGDLIYRGLTSTRNEVVLAGAIPAALLAILFDVILKRIELATDPKRGQKFSIKKLVIIILVPVLVLGGITIYQENKADKTIVISGKNWTEQLILPHIIAEYLKNKTDYPVTVNDGLGDTPILTQAIQKGDIDIYVEYTGTGLLTILKEQYDPNMTPDEIFQKTQAGYREKLQLEWLKPLGFENTYAITLNPQVAKTLGIQNISELSSRSPELLFGGPAPFYEREDGYDQFVKAYNLQFKEKKSLDSNLMYSAVKEGEVDLIPGFTTDGRIVRFNLHLLKDDKKFFPPYYAAPIVNQETLKKYPELKEILNQLAGKISNEEMAEMNAQVDIDKKNPKKVAINFLKKEGLIK